MSSSTIRRLDFSAFFPSLWNMCRENYSETLHTKRTIHSVLFLAGARPTLYLSLFHTPVFSLSPCVATHFFVRPRSCLQLICSSISTTSLFWHFYSRAGGCFFARSSGGFCVCVSVLAVVFTRFQQHFAICLHFAVSQFSDVVRPLRCIARNWITVNTYSGPVASKDRVRERGKK